MKNLMKKSVAARIKITKKGKIIRRQMGQSHCKAKKSGSQTRRKRKDLCVSPVDVRMFKKYL